MKQKTTGKNRNGEGTASTLVESQITWHLYAAHAAMEHRQNHLPKVAARIYELGVKCDPSFVAVPAYVQRYAQVLMEINDLTSLRSLLTKSVSACEVAGNKAAVASVWDISLHFESSPNRPRCERSKRREEKR
jgi:Suppressor of forked protein (Suf)